MWLTPTRQPFASAIGGCSRAPSGPSTTSISRGSVWPGSSRVSPGTATCVRSTRAWPRSLRCPTAARSSTLLAALASPFAPCAKSSVCATSATTSRRRCCDAPAGGGDNAAAAVGVGVVRERLISSSIGTSGVLFAHSDSFARDPSGRVHAFCHAVPGAYHLMAVTLSAGGSLNWWRERVADHADFAALVAEAAEVEPGAEGLLFLPHLTGERTPHLDPRARGAFVGLTARHGRLQLTRAVMEGVVLSMRAGLEVMRALGTAVDEVRATGGGARSPLWLQLQADIYGCPVRRTFVDEGPAYGAALLAGVASGVFDDIQAACAGVRLRESITDPDPQRASRYDELYSTFASLYPALRDAM